MTLAEAVKLLVSLHQIASHPQLVEPAAVLSPFHMDEIDYHVARLVESVSDRSSGHDVCVTQSRARVCVCVCVLVILTMPCVTRPRTSLIRP